MVASRTVLVRIRADADQFNRELAMSSTSMHKLGDESDRSGKSIDRFSGRLAVLGELAGSLGPGLVPILATSAQAVAGIATQVGFATLAAGSAVIAFQGMGDALKALSDARLDPTTANLAKAEQAIERLSPAGQDLAHTIAGLSDEWERSKAIAQGGLFAGAESAIGSLMTRLPELQHVLATVSTTAGDLLAEGADSVASSRWDALFVYLETSAKPIMTDTAHTAGSLAHAMSELIIAMDPLSRDFAAGLAAGADQLDRWATGLKGTQDFEEFVAYVRTEGPEVAATVGDIASSLVSLLEAGSGSGSAALQMLQGLAGLVSTVAESPLGPVLIQLIQVVSTLALLNRGLNAFSSGAIGGFVRGQGQAVVALTGTISAQDRARLSVQQLAAAEAGLSTERRAALGTLTRGAAGIAGMGLAALNASHHVTGLGAASGALMGWSVGGPWGAAIGGAIGLLTDFAQQSQDAAARSDEFAGTLDTQTGALTENSRAWVAHQLGADFLNDITAAGLSTKELITAILQGGDAYAEFQAKAAAALGEVKLTNDELIAAGQTRDYSLNNSGAVTNAYAGTIEDLRGVVVGATGDERTYNDAIGDTGGAFANATPKVQTFTGALADLNGWLDKRAAWRDYIQSVRDATKVLGDNKSTHKEIAEALDNVARNTGEVAGMMKKTERQEFLKQARADLRDLQGQGAVADGIVKKILQHLRDLDGTRVKTYIETVHVSRSGPGGTGSGDSGGGGIPGVATGGHIRGPGTRTSDSITARLSDYEYVVKAKAVEHYGVDFMDAVNNMRFAGGGLVTGDPRPSWAASRPTIIHDTGGTVAQLTETNQRLGELAGRVSALQSAVEKSAHTSGAVLGKVLNNAATDAWTGGAP